MQLALFRTDIDDLTRIVENDFGVRSIEVNRAARNATFS
jgi:hypothetical protein